MKITIEEKLPNGDTTKRRLWGVSFQPEKRRPRAEFRPQIIGETPDGIPITDEDTPAHAKRLDEMATRQLAWDEKVETVTKAAYIVRIRLLGKQRHVGSTATPQGAARLYDSALFHLWGWIKRPSAHFNYFRPNTPTPELLPKVKEMQMKLNIEARKKGLDPAVFSYTFAQRNDH